MVDALLPQIAENFGNGYAFGYTRWLAQYAVAKIALLAGPARSQAGAEAGDWWIDGAALYLTDRLARDAHSTSPILYGLEGTFVRAAQRGDRIVLANDASAADDPARGKAYATFKLFEAAYGADVVSNAIAALAASSDGDGLDALLGALGSGASELLSSWLDSTTSFDISVNELDIADDGGSLSGQLRRRGGISTPVVLEIRCRDGLTYTTQLPAGGERQDFEADLACEAGQLSEIRLDPEGLLPDVNRANNRRGFGDASRIRRFFEFDDVIRIGELQFDGTIELDAAGQRVEKFSVAVANLVDEPTGMGLLVSAEWANRPERTQRAYFFNLGPRERRVLHEVLAYPNRGTNRSTVAARYWRAPDAATLTERLVSHEPEALNTYVVLRDAPEAPRRARRGLNTTPPEITVTTAALDPESATGATETDGQSPSIDSSDAAAPNPVGADTLDLELLSPREGSVPIGDVELEALVTGGEPQRVDFYVNDRRIGAAMVAPYKVRWSSPDEERVFVIRAVAVSGGGVASDDVVLNRSGLGFGATVDLVTLHATVRASGGGLVRGLRAEDFSVFEDGARQTLTQVDYGEIPVSAILLLDTSSSMIGGGIRAERAGAKRLVDALLSADESAAGVGELGANRVMVLGFNSRLHLYSDFNNDPTALEPAIEAALPDGGTALFDALAQSLRKANRASGKRALIVLSDGLDTESSFAYEDVVEYARQSDVLIYSIGLQLMHEGTEYGDASGAVKRGVDQLRSMAETTGGAAYFPLNLEELEEIYAAIAQELRGQYALSFSPLNQSWDGRWRELSVQLPGHPGAIIQVRPGYYGVPPEGR